jgi:hypothetical protein
VQQIGIVISQLFGAGNDERAEDRSGFGPQRHVRNVFAQVGYNAHTHLRGKLEEATARPEP